MKLGRFVMFCGLAAAGVAVAAEPSVEEMLSQAAKGPSLLFTRDMLPGIAQRAAQNKEAGNVLKSLVNRTNGRMRQAAKVPDRGGQWTLWMTCKKCSSHVKSKTPTLHVCTTCGTEHTGWPYDDCYISGWHMNCANMIRDCGVLWGVIGEMKYAEYAKNLLLAYADAYGKYEWHGRNGPLPGPKKGGARAFAQILDEAVWLVPILDGYDAIRDILTDGERAKIETQLLRASAETIMTENAKWSNHEVWHLAAYGMAGVALRDAKLLDKSLNGEYGALRQLEHGILSDGIWYEGSLHYHYYTLQAFLPYFRTLSHLGYTVPVKFKEMFTSPIGQLAPDRMRPPINDSWPGKFEPGDYERFYELAAAWWDDDVFKWWVTQKRRTTTEYLLWGRDFGGAEKLPEIGSRVYDANGLAVLRSRSAGAQDVIPDNCVMIDYGPHGEWHGHPDKLNLMIWLHGKCVAEDPGCVGYGDPMHWGWYKSTLAHNTLQVDNRNQGMSCGELVALVTNENFAAVATRTRGNRAKARWDGSAYEGVEMLRITALCGDVVLDYLEGESAAEHDYGWCFHSRGEMDFSGGTAVTNLPPRLKFSKYPPPEQVGDDAWGWASDVKEKANGSEWRTAWKGNGYTLNLWQKATGTGMLRTGKAPAQPPSKKLTLAVNRVRGKRAAFASVFGCDREMKVEFGEILNENAGAKGFEVRIDGKRYVLRLEKTCKLSLAIE